MMYDLMKRCVLLGVAALLAAACFNDKDLGTERTTQFVVGFEPDSEGYWEQFLNEYFDNGKDTVSVYATFPRYETFFYFYYAKLDDKGGFLGGLILARGHDADAAADRVPSRLAVYDKEYGNEKSKVYAVFHDTTATLMPEHTFQIYIPNTESSCTAVTMYAHNVQAAVQAAKYGVGLADGPFQDNDHLTLTVTGRSGTNVTGQVEVKLIDGTKIVDEWKEVSLKDLGKIDAIDMHLASSRSDFPLYCCVDDMWYTYAEVYR